MFWLECIHFLQARYVKAVGVGILKVMAKMGISTLQSYKGAQIFEALGLNDDVVSACFKGTPSRIGGMSFADLGRGSIQAHTSAFAAQSLNPNSSEARSLPDPGDYKHRVNQDKSSEVRIHVSSRIQLYACVRGRQARNQ